MNPKEEQDLRAEMADAVEDKCLYMGVCPNTLNTVLSIIDPKNHKRKRVNVILVGIKDVNLMKEYDYYVFMGR